MLGAKDTAARGQSAIGEVRLWPFAEVVESFVNMRLSTGTVSLRYASSTRKRK